MVVVERGGPLKETVHLPHQENGDPGGLCRMSRQGQGLPAPPVESPDF